MMDYGIRIKKRHPVLPYLLIIRFIFVHIWVTGETKEQQRHGGYAVALKFSMTFTRYDFGQHLI
jgi:hypothetical protein